MSVDETTSVGDWLALGEGEEVRWNGHPRLTTVFPSVVVGLALAVGPVVAVLWDVPETTPDLPPFVLLLVPVGVAIPAWSYLAVTNTRFVVTDRALYRKTGVLSRRVRRVSLDRVQNSHFRQGVRGSLFGYGSIDFEVAGGGRVAFENVENAREFRAFVDERFGGESGIPGSVEQWTAVLEVVRALRRAVEESS